MDFYEQYFFKELSTPDYEACVVGSTDCTLLQGTHNPSLTTMMAWDASDEGEAGRKSNIYSLGSYGLVLFFLEWPLKLLSGRVSVQLKPHNRKQSKGRGPQSQQHDLCVVVMPGNAWNHTVITQLLHFHFQMAHFQYSSQQNQVGFSSICNRKRTGKYTILMIFYYLIFISQKTLKRKYLGGVPGPEMVFPSLNK